MEPIASKNKKKQNKTKQTHLLEKDWKELQSINYIWVVEIGIGGWSLLKQELESLCSANGGKQQRRNKKTFAGKSPRMMESYFLS